MGLLMKAYCYEAFSAKAFRAPSFARLGGAVFSITGLGKTVNAFWRGLRMKSWEELTN